MGKLQTEITLSTSNKPIRNNYDHSSTSVKT